MATWYLDAEARRLIAFRYLPWLVVLNLAWEIAQLPLYTLWREASAAYVAFSVAHCTVGDGLIGITALAAALVLTRAAQPARWRWARIAVVTALLGTVYSVFSEWMNTAVVRGWAYSESMPVVRMLGAEIGVSPLAQWLLLPPLALWLARLRAIGPGRGSGPRRASD